MDTTTQPQQTFSDQVNTVVGSMEKDAKGIWQIPNIEDHSEELQYAAMSEKRRRDTQSSYVKATQSLSQANTERDALKTRLASTITLTLTQDQHQELADLKITDPDKWKSKLDGYEADAKEELNIELTKFSDDAVKNSHVESRKVILQEYIEANPGFSLDDDILANDVPPRITNKLANGEITFEAFLSEVHTYLEAPKVIDTTDTTTSTTNLAHLAGTSTPSVNAQAADSAADYATKDIF